MRRFLPVILLGVADERKEEDGGCSEGAAERDEDV
jgi:hypothetical protein